LLQGTNKLWVNTLSHKYTSGARILNHSTSTPSSIIWNSIIKAKNILKNGFSWRAGSGESSFWSSHWTSFGPLCANVPYVHINDIALKINEVYATTPPNLNMLHTLLPLNILDEIINLSFHFNSNTKDTFIWHENSNGIYTTKVDFSWFLKQRGGDATFISWAWIWRLHLPEKIKFLVWMAHNNFVPTLLDHRNLSPNVLCPRCSSFEETILHCIRDYLTSTHLWHALGFTSVECFSNTNVSCWLKQGLTS